MSTQILKLSCFGVQNEHSKCYLGQYSTRRKMTILLIFNFMWDFRRDSLQNSRGVDSQAGGRASSSPTIGWVVFFARGVPHPLTDS